MVRAAIDTVDDGIGTARQLVVEATFDQASGDRFAKTILMQGQCRYIKPPAVAAMALCIVLMMSLRTERSRNVVSAPGSDPAPQALRARPVQTVSSLAARPNSSRRISGSASPPGRRSTRPAVS